MTSLIKYLSVFILTFSLIGCQNDSPRKGSAQEQQPQQSLQDQMQQSAPDVEVSENELETFTDAIVSAQQIQMKAQQGMVDIIENEGLDVETYNKIAQSVQMGQSPEQAGVSNEDVEKFENVSEDIKQAQSEIQQEVSNAVEDAGMEMKRFQEINQAVQQDSELQKRVVEKMQGNRMQQPSQGSQPDEN